MKASNRPSRYTAGEECSSCVVAVLNVGSSSVTPFTPPTYHLSSLPHRSLIPHTDITERYGILPTSLPWQITRYLRNGAPNNPPYTMNSYLHTYMPTELADVGPAPSNELK